jgi:hypothetical protein
MVEMSMRSMILSRVIDTSIIVLLCLLTSCSTYTNELTQFPSRATMVPYTKKPVQGYSSTSKTYSITDEYMKNSLMDHIYVEEVLKWKRDNGVR